jgi:hypothetical protein
MNSEYATGQTPENKDSASEGFTDQRVDMMRNLIRKEVEGVLSGPAVEHKPLPAEPIALDAQVLLPGATEALLNAQLLECVGILRDAGHLYRNTVIEPNERGFFINHASRLMEISATLAGAVARLRSGQEPVKTTRHITVVEHVGGRGKPDPENE